MSTRRRARVGRSTVVLLVAVVLLAAGTWVAYFSPLLVVREVAVAGQRSVTAEEVVAAAAVPVGAPLARQAVQAIAERTPRNSLLATSTTPVIGGGPSGAGTNVTRSPTAGCPVSPSARCSTGQASSAVTAVNPIVTTLLTGRPAKWSK